MATERVADMTVEELKAVITEVVQEQLSHLLNPANTGYARTDGYYVLPKRTEAEQRQKHQQLIKLFDKWAEEDEEEEEGETFEYLQQLLDEDRLSNRSLFPKQ